MFCDYIWSICRGKSQVPNAARSEKIFAYINTSQAQTKKRKWKDFVFSVLRSTMYLSCVIRESITRDKSWNTVMNIWVWIFKHKDKKKNLKKVSPLPVKERKSYFLSWKYWTFWWKTDFEEFNDIGRFVNKSYFRHSRFPGEKKYLSFRTFN